MHIKIGMQYIKRGDKLRHVRTVVDILKTYDVGLKLVHVRYVTTRTLGYQVITEHDVVQPTIAIGLIN